MNFIQTILGWPLGWVMRGIYFITGNYGVSLLLFTVITRLFMVPTAIKQQKSSVKMQMIKPQIDELQKKYANNKEKLNTETMALYKKEGYSPMAGCLPLLIQFPILLGLIDVIYKPLRHVLGIATSVIDSGMEILSGLVDTSSTMTAQIDLIRHVKADPSLFMDAMGADAITAIEHLNLNFLGLDLTASPSWDLFKQIFTDFHPVILVPILSGVTSLLVSLISTRVTSQSMDNQAANSMKGMMLIMPIFSFYIAMRVPAGVGLYWTFSNLCAIAQSLLLYKFLNPKEAAEKYRLVAEERKERERQERIEAKKLAKQGALDNKEKAMSQKEINRLKLAEARRRDAEKYGEEYVDVTDADLK